MQEFGKGGILLEVINYLWWQVWRSKSSSLSQSSSEGGDGGNSSLKHVGNGFKSGQEEEAQQQGEEAGDNNHGVVIQKTTSETARRSISSSSSSIVTESRSQSASAAIGTVLTKRSSAATGGKEQEQRTTFSLRDVEKHSTREDCWIVIKDKVYDVSIFAKEHPGGDVLYTHAGRDATDVFSTFHAPSTWTLLRRFCIGDFADEEPTPELLKDFRDLRSSLLREKMFESNKLYYLFKILSLLISAAVSLTILSYSASSFGWWGVVCSAFFMALTLQQSGWLAHDFLHHQVFERRQINHFFGYILGNVVQGFSAGWWRSKHNKHHAAPNECDEEFNAVDPDIDTLPLLAWSRDMLRQIDEKDRFYRALIRIQCYIFFPILLFARLSWCQQSVMYGQEKKLPLGEWLIEKSLLLVHYSWVFGAAFGMLPPLQALTWVLLCELLCGLLLGIVFVQSHNGMEVYNDIKDFVRAQVVSTRDIRTSLFNDWFTGGLNRQIEHHLFPTLPRHNLGKVAGRVKALCEKHGLVYEDVGMVTGTRRVLERLADVARAA